MFVFMIIMKKLQKNAAHILEVKNRLGIHIRPAWMIVRIAYTNSTS